MTPPRRLLVVSPGFHGYWRAIAGAFASRGSAVRTAVYDAPRSLAGRVRNKLLHELPPRARPGVLRSRLTEQAIDAVRGFDPTAVLVLKGDLLGDAFWHELDARSLPTVLWLYDEVRRTEHTLERLRGVGRVASYSAGDVASLRGAGVEATHVPLAFDTSIAVEPRPVGAVTLVGARYAGRESLLRAMSAAGVSVRAYGDAWSRRPIDVLRTRAFGDPGVPASPALERAAAYGVFAGSTATLNVHADQDGFTMRTFEAAGVGGVQLIDRADVGAFYEPGTEVLAFSTADEAIAHAQRAARDRAWTASIRRRARARTLAEHTFAHRARTLEALWH